MRLVLRVAVVVAILVAVLMTAHRVVRAPWHEFGDARIARSAAVLYGYGLYESVEELPRLDNLYGPFSALFYVPAVFISSTPSGALWLGSASSFLILTLPVLWLLALGSGIRSIATAAAFSGFWLFLFHTSMFIPFGIHADQPGGIVKSCGSAIGMIRRLPSDSSPWYRVPAADHR